MKPSRVAVIGSGYVGLSTAVVLAEKGLDVTCVDSREDVVDAIRRKVSPIHEEGLPEALRAVALPATTDLAGAVRHADVVFLCVGTPTKDGSDSADLSYLERAAAEVGRAMQAGGGYRTVAVKSTVPPGTTDTLARRVLEESSGRAVGDGDGDFGLAMVPEFLREGMSLQDARRPGRIVLGVENRRAEAELRRVFDPFEVPLVVTNARTAELAKYMSNALLATLISFGNDFSNLAAALGCVDMHDALEVLAHDPRWWPRREMSSARPEILSYLTPGPGFGGSCFPKDLRAILSHADESRYPLSLPREALRINEAQGDLVADRLEKMFADGLHGRRFGVYGLAFKPGTDDVRESPAARVIASIARRGASIAAYDPVAVSNYRKAYAQPEGLSFVADARDLFSGTDGVIVVTPWADSLPVFYDADTYRAARHALVYDARAALDVNRMRLMPCAYLSPLHASGRDRD